MKELHSLKDHQREGRFALRNTFLFDPIRSEVFGDLVKQATHSSQDKESDTYIRGGGFVKNLSHVSEAEVHDAETKNPKYGNVTLIFMFCIN